jgi:hypothetical protein
VLYLSEEVTAVTCNNRYGAVFWVACDVIAAMLDWFMNPTWPPRLYYFMQTTVTAEYFDFNFSTPVVVLLI